MKNTVITHLFLKAPYFAATSIKVILNPILVAAIKKNQNMAVHIYTHVVISIFHLFKAVIKFILILFFKVVGTPLTLPLPQSVLSFISK